MNQVNTIFQISEMRTNEPLPPKYKIFEKKFLILDKF